MIFASKAAYDGGVVFLHAASRVIIAMKVKGKIVVFKKACNLIVTLGIHGPRPLRACLLGWHRESRKWKENQRANIESPWNGKNGFECNVATVSTFLEGNEECKGASSLMRRRAWYVIPSARLLHPI